MRINRHMLKRAEREARRCFTARFKRRVDHLKTMLRSNAPPVILVNAAEMVCRERYGGYFGYFLHTAYQLASHWKRAMVWQTRKGWWKLRYPRKHWTDVAQEIYSAQAEAHNAECDQAGHPEFKL